MKRILTAALVLLIGWMTGSDALRAQQGMQAQFSYSSFYEPDSKTPYVETYLSFDAWTMAFKEMSVGEYRATLEVEITVMQSDSVCYHKQYDLNSPVVGNLNSLNFNFLDVQRFALRNGLYNLRIDLRDKNREGSSAMVTEKLIINYDDVHPTLSSLQPMASAKPTKEANILSRGGYDMEPYVSDFYPEQVKQMSFYYEIYNITAEVGQKAFLTLAYIEQYETGQRFENQQLVNRRNGKAYIPVYGTLDISELPSGNYNLVVELRNKDNQLMLYKKSPFYRSNPGVKGKELSDFSTTFAGRYTDEAELNLYLSALYPVASEREKNLARELVRKPGLVEKQAFLYQFWQSRNNLNPESEWLKYKERIDYVQANFTYAHVPGVQTDRGRVFLQYGPPDYVRDEKNFVGAMRLGTVDPVKLMGDDTRAPLQQSNMDDRNATKSRSQVFYLPYQLWRYNSLPANDADRVFLFWDEHRSGNYRLLNSNARGEVHESGWERRLSRQQLEEGVVGEVGEQFNRGY